MNDDQPYQKWLSQLRKGYLEMCVLVSLERKRSSYGFELLQIFESAGIDINEGTLYPLLNRMHKNGWLESTWETPVDGGHPRRFYSLSNTGLALLPKMLESYKDYQASLENLRNQPK